MSYQRPENRNQSSPRLDDPRDYLLRTMHHWAKAQFAKNENSRLPPPLPTDHQEAADEWMRFYQRPRRPDEAPVKTSDGMIDPYVTRLISTLAQFLSLPDDKHRHFVRACIEDGIDYRGDSVEQLRSVYEETMRMRKVGKDAYICEALDKAYRVTGVRLA